MKKLFALILSAALALSLTACGGSGTGDNNDTSSTGNGDTTSTDTTNGGMTKEEMLEVAEEGDISELNSLIAENILSAKQAYCGKVLTIKGKVDEINMDCIVFHHGMGSVIVYLPEEDIINLKTGQWITFVGLTDEELVTTKESRWGSPAFDYTDCIMSQAYLLEDRYEYTGTPKSENDSFPGAWNVEFPGNAFLKLVYFDESIDVSQYRMKEIKFSAKNIDGTYYDAFIIE